MVRRCGALLYCTAGWSRRARSAVALGPFGPYHNSLFVAPRRIFPSEVDDRCLHLPSQRQSSVLLRLFHFHHPSGRPAAAVAMSGRYSYCTYRLGIKSIKALLDPESIFSFLITNSVFPHALLHQPAKSNIHRPSYKQKPFWTFSHPLLLSSGILFPLNRGSSLDLFVLVLCM